MRIAKNLSNVCLCVPDFFFCNMHRFFDGKNAPSEYLDKAFFLCIEDYYHTTHLLKLSQSAFRIVGKVVMNSDVPKNTKPKGEE